MPDFSEAKNSVEALWGSLNRAVAESPQTLFLREWLANPATMGAVCASSPRLAARMAACVDLGREGVVVELGGGTGVITSALLAHGVPPERLAVIEYSDALAEHLHKTFPQIRVINGDAGDLPEMLATGQLGGTPTQPATIGTIVSGLPLLSMPAKVRDKILEAGVASLAKHARLLQFTYALHGASPWEKAGLVVEHSERVLANLPPARIDVLRAI